MSYEPTQKECSELVHREVILCVTGVVNELTYHETTIIYDCDNGQLLLCMECGEQLPADAKNEDIEDEAIIEQMDHQTGRGYECPSCQSWMDLDFCDAESQEVLEWWAVTEWLARQLASRGEVVHHNLYGLTVWGRCCSGQAIKLDGVIVDITRELHEGGK
jgi:DNA-directed RNA polymerase subunit RPC12/RpoP